MRPQRRTYSKSFKAQVIQECSEPGASIANIALGYSLNANLDHKWIRLPTQKTTAIQPAFIPLPSQMLGVGSHTRAAAIMSLIQSARNNGHDPYAYLKDVLTRLPSL
ncbi:Putative transposase (identified by ISEscan HMM) [Klebsiella pneumoniae]|nr:Putative transposase (identified by ISEscan HMM) [Klebsiella pneumoniae]